MSDARMPFQPKPFTRWVEIDISDFTAQEIALLQRYGSWYQDLQDGVVAAVSDAQLHFAKCANGKVDPLSSHEIVWRKYLSASQLRRERLKHNADQIAKNLKNIQTDDDRRALVPQWGRDVQELKADYYEDIIYPYIDKDR